MSLVVIGSPSISFYKLNRGEDWKKFKALFVEIRKKMFCIVSSIQWWMEEMRVWDLGGAQFNSHAPPSPPLQPPSAVLGRLQTSLINKILKWIIKSSFTSITAENKTISCTDFMGAKRMYSIHLYYENFWPYFCKVFASLEILLQVD